MMRNTKLESLEWISVNKPLFWPNHYINGFILENNRAILFDHKRIGFFRTNQKLDKKFNLCS